MSYFDNRLRPIISVLCKDYVRYAVALANSGPAYLGLRNRHERLETSPTGTGFHCKWQWTSELYAPQHVKSLGVRLMRRALSDHPVTRAATPGKCNGPAVISFVIGHRGVARLPHLLATLGSIAGQRGTSVECVVVEQDTEPHVAKHLPTWVNYVHTPPPVPDMPYCRAWAFNIGVKHSTGKLLVLHDNDMLVPNDYAANILELMGQGYEVINLKRFIFYLTEQHTRAIFDGNASLTTEAPLSIVQNLEGGGSVAITREAYEQIGGLDESFIGWGGEDNEFWERAQTRRLWPYAYLPLVHLWHMSQPEKLHASPAGQALFYELSRRPVNERIARLRSTPHGDLDGPFKTELASG